MEKLKDEDVTLGKYQDADIDEYSIFFSHNNEPSLVDEYEIPKDYQYTVMTGTREGHEFPDWVTVTNPDGLKKVIENDNECLPDLLFEFRGEEITLINFFKKHIFNMNLS